MMQKFKSTTLGAVSGITDLFSDFEDGGAMWTGEGERSRTIAVAFEEAFNEPPVVHAGLSLWDVSDEAPARIDLFTQNITCEGFELVVKTWGNTKIARLRASWFALGEVRGDDLWDV